MSRFDQDPKELAAKAQAAHDRATKERASYDGGAPNPRAVEPEEPAPRKSKRTAASSPPADDAMKFTVRLNITFSENDPVGRVLAERMRSLPENSRKHYAVGRVVRDAIMQDLDAIAERI